MNLTSSRAARRARHRTTPTRRLLPSRSLRRHLAVATVLAAVMPLLGAVSAMSPSLGSSPRVAGEHLFPRSSVPATRVVPDGKSVELGTRFRVTRRGTITAVRYFATPANRGAHRANLWSASGKRLASARFPRSTRTGWRVARLSHPVHVRPHRTYVVSYHARKGHYAATAWGFRRPRSRGHLWAPRGAGVFRYGLRSRFPTHRWHRSNYYVDVTFVPRRRGGGSAHKSPGAYPTAGSVGLPAGWRPARTVNGDLWVRRAGAVVSDVRVNNGTIHVAAPNVTLRRIQGLGAIVDNDADGSCNNGLVIEQSEFHPAGQTTDRDPPVIGQGGYVLRDSLVDGVPEGPRVGGTDIGCGPVTVQHTFIRIASPDVCNDWHGDGIQGYGGAKVTVRRVTIYMQVDHGCYGTAPFFYPSRQGNTAVDIDGLIVAGGGYPFRDGMPGPVRDLFVLRNSWVYGPVDVNCRAVTAWGAHVATLSRSGQPVRGRAISCTGSGT